MSETNDLEETDDFEEFDNNDEILFFGAHVPNILLHRCIRSIYENRTCPTRPQQFIARFDGSLLFVDISGFTALSRCVHVERLKTYINAYFTKMLNVVEKYGGSVAKFAGDALYIIWPATLADSLEQSVQKAFLCSIDITSVCNDYAVSLDESSEGTFTEGTFTSSRITPASSPTGGGRPDSPRIYMNVHSGISVGVMALVDVGCNGRWEMLLLGQPLNDVAIAVNQARSGEVLLSGMAFKSLQQGMDTYTVEERTEGCFAVSKVVPIYARPVYMYPGEDEDEDDQIEDSDASLAGGKKMLITALLHEEYLKEYSIIDENVIEFSEWLLEDRQVLAKQYIMDTIKAHVHEAARLSTVVKQPVTVFKRPNPDVPPSSPSIPSSRRSKMLSQARSEFFLQLERKDTMVISEMIMNQTAELRQCTTLFINISINVNLYIDHNVDRRELKGLQPFITRSDEEINSDNRLLNELQMCMKIVTKTLIDKGGQVRQFIHDDKGTVCIGTIGLRGSTTENNSAAAVVAAKSIIIQLQLNNINASIGIASGLAFCGLVGSSVRHEYAVMGPSVNLSARLMSAASLGCILCDQKTRDADRRHKYQVMSSISAKGYDGLVSIFSPIWEISRKNSYLMPACPSPHYLKSTSSISRSNSSCRSRSSSSSCSSPIPSNCLTPNSNSISPIFNRYDNGYLSDSSSDDDDENDNDNNDRINDTESMKNNLNYRPHILRGSFSHGLFGRGKTLTEIFAFLALESRSIINTSFRAALHAAKIGAGTIELSPHSVVAASDLNNHNQQMKMKLLIVSGPYGIGKSALLEAVYSEIHVIPSPSTSSSSTSSSSSSSSSSSPPTSSSSSSMNNGNAGYKFKYYIKADSYDTTTPFLAFKKILSYLLSMIHFEIPYQDVLSIEEKEQTQVQTQTQTQITNTYKKATILSQLRRNVSQTREIIIDENIHQILALIDPTLGYLKPLLFNGFLSDSVVSLSSHPLLLGMSERDRNNKTIYLLSAIFQKITEVIGGSILLAIDDIQSMDPSSWNLLRYFWSNNYNMTIICTFRTFGVSGCSLLEGDNLRRTWTESKNEEINLDAELKYSFIDSDTKARRRRLFLVELETLNESATLHLTLHLLQEEGAMMNDDEKSLNIMYSLCGGNPFYAVELTKASIKMVRNSNINDNNNNNHNNSINSDNTNDNNNISFISSQIWSKIFLKIASKSRPERIEEIIIYRFDQLSSKSQLLLRVAAVAAYNNASFTAKMLSFVLPEFSGARTQGELFSSNGGCIHELLKEALEKESDSDDDTDDHTDDDNNKSNDDDGSNNDDDRNNDDSSNNNNKNNDNNNNNKKNDNNYNNDNNSIYTNDEINNIFKSYRDNVSQPIGSENILKVLREIMKESEFIRLVASTNNINNNDENNNNDNNIENRSPNQDSLLFYQSNYINKNDENKKSNEKKKKSSHRRNFVEILCDELSLFEFTSPLVQATILNLSLHTQNSWFHTKVAEYLESEVLGPYQKPRKSTDSPTKRRRNSCSGMLISMIDDNEKKLRSNSISLKTFPASKTNLDNLNNSMNSNNLNNTIGSDNLNTSTNSSCYSSPIRMRRSMTKSVSEYIDIDGKNNNNNNTNSNSNNSKFRRRNSLGVTRMSLKSTSSSNLHSPCARDPGSAFYPSSECKGITSQDWFKMGTHWQRSSCNLKAMACFYHAAVTQEGLKKGERLSHLLRSYSILKILRFEADCSYSTYNFTNKKEKEKEISDRPSRLSLTNRMLGIDGNGVNVQSPKANRLSRRPNLKVIVNPIACLTKEIVFDIFHGDSLAIRIAFQMLLELSRSIFPTRTDRSTDMSTTSRSFSASLSNSYTNSPLPHIPRSNGSEKKDEKEKTKERVNVKDKDEEVEKKADDKEKVKESQKEEEKEREKEKDNTSCSSARFLSEALDLLEACPGSSELSPSPLHIPRSPTQGPMIVGTLDLNPQYHVETLQPDLYGLPLPARTTGQIERENENLSSEMDGHFFRREIFGLQEYSLRLSIQSGIIHLSLMDLLLEGNVEGPKSLCTQFIDCSRQHGDAHLIQALRLQSILYARTNRFENALEICDEIGELYVHAEHSKELLRVYGEDSGILAIAWAAVGNLLIGNCDKSLTFCKVVEMHLPFVLWPPQPEQLQSIQSVTASFNLLSLNIIKKKLIFYNLKKEKEIRSYKSNESESYHNENENTNIVYGDYFAVGSRMGSGPSSPSVPTPPLISVSNNTICKSPPISTVYNSNTTPTAISTVSNSAPISASTISTSVPISITTVFNLNKNNIIQKIGEDKTSVRSPSKILPKSKPYGFLATVAASAQKVARKFSKNNSATTSSKGYLSASSNTRSRVNSIETMSLTTSKSDSESTFEIDSVMNSLLTLKINNALIEKSKNLEYEIIEKEFLDALDSIGNCTVQCPTQVPLSNSCTKHNIKISPYDSILNLNSSIDMISFGDKFHNLIIKTRLLSILISECCANNIHIDNNYLFKPLSSCD